MKRPKGRPPKYPFAKLEIGEHFQFEPHLLSRVTTAAQMRRLRGGGTFDVWLDCGVFKCVRVR